MSLLIFHYRTWNKEERSWKTTSRAIFSYELSTQRLGNRLRHAWDWYGLERQMHNQAATISFCSEDQRIICLVLESRGRSDRPAAPEENWRTWVVSWCRCSAGLSVNLMIKSLPTHFHFFFLVALSLNDLTVLFSCLTTFLLLLIPPQAPPPIQVKPWTLRLWKI